MRRRDVFAALGKMGFLHPRMVAPDSPTVRDLRRVWEQLGYAEPDTLLLRSANNDVRELPQLAAELIGLGAGLLMTVGPAAGLAAAATGAPVVALDLETDPVRRGLAATFARPGDQVTGLTVLQADEVIA